MFLWLFAYIIVLASQFTVKKWWKIVVNLKLNHLDSLFAYTLHNPINWKSSTEIAFRKAQRALKRPLASLADIDCLLQCDLCLPWQLCTCVDFSTFNLHLICNNGFRGCHFKEKTLLMRKKNNIIFYTLKNLLGNCSVSSNPR